MNRCNVEQSDFPPITHGRRREKEKTTILDVKMNSGKNPIRQARCLFPI